MWYVGALLKGLNGQLRARGDLGLDRRAKVYHFLAKQFFEEGENPSLAPVLEIRMLCKQPINRPWILLYRVALSVQSKIVFVAGEVLRSIYVFSSNIVGTLPFLFFVICMLCIKKKH